MAKFDELANSKFAMVKNYNMLQVLNMDDVVSCDCFPNKYAFTDRDRPIDVAGAKKPDFTPVFIAEEESGCCCRGCCAPVHPFTLKFYHADPVPTAGADKGCACLAGYTGHQYKRDAANPNPIFTLDRPGCCSQFPGKCFGCVVCCNMCQHEMFMFDGNKQGEPGTLALDGGAIGSIRQPICGGGCTPTLILSKGNDGAEEMFAAVEGPTCFGGCKDLFCATPFTVSSAPGKLADRGMITKNRPEDCMGLCCAVCTDVDGYTIGLGDSKDPTETAMTLGTSVLLDYMFFEKDNSFCEYDPNSNTIIITLCYWYMCGALMPVCCVIPLSEGG